MRWPQVVSAIVAAAVLSVAIPAHANGVDLPSPPVPRKSIPTPPAPQETALPGDSDPAERVRFDHEQAAIQAELESSHRDAAKSWRSRLAEQSRSRPRPTAAAERSSKDLKGQVDQEEAAAEYHGKLKRQYRLLASDPGGSFPPDLPPLPTSRGREQDRAVLEAVLRDVLGSWAAEERGRGARRDFVLHAFSLCDTTPGEFGGLLDDAGVPKGLAEELESDLGRRNAGGPVALDGLTFEDPRIVVKDLGKSTDARTGDGPDEMSGSEFLEEYPEVQGYAKAYLPGYTRDGKTAAVRMVLGPPAEPHGFASYSGIAVKSQDGWRIKWKSIDHPE